MAGVWSGQEEQRYAGALWNQQNKMEKPKQSHRRNDLYSMRRVCRCVFESLCDIKTVKVNVCIGLLCVCVCVSIMGAT